MMRKMNNNGFFFDLISIYLRTDRIRASNLQLYFNLNNLNIMNTIYITIKLVKIKIFRKII